MKKLFLAATALVALATSAHAQTFNMTNASAIVKDSRDNEVKFNRDYKGKSFSDVLPFKSVSENWLGGWLVDFNGAYCFVDEDMAKKMADWRKGQRVRVTGTINTTMFGDIKLDNCKFGELAVAPPSQPTFDSALAQWRALNGVRQ